MMAGRRGGPWRRGGWGKRQLALPLSCRPHLNRGGKQWAIASHHNTTAAGLLQSSHHPDLSIPSPPTHYYDLHCVVILIDCFLLPS